MSPRQVAPPAVGALAGGHSGARAYIAPGAQELYGMLVQHFALRADARPLPLDELDALTVHLLELTPEVRRASVSALPRGARSAGHCERRAATQRVRGLSPAVLRGCCTSWWPQTGARITACCSRFAPATHSAASRLHCSPLQGPYHTYRYVRDASGPL